MPNRNSTTPASAGETQLRGKGLEGAEQKDAADHVAYNRKRNPDTVVRADGEADTLYTDGLEVGDDTDTLFGTQKVNRGS